MANIITKHEIIHMYNCFKQYALSVKNLNIKCRMPNFPEHISENLIVYLLNTHLNVPCHRSNTKGDIETFDNKKIECKTASSTGPISFGPKEEWNVLYILDIQNYIINDYFKLYEINVNSKNFNINVSRNETFLDQINQKRRPRITLRQLLPQIEHKIVYEGCIKNI